MHLFFLVFHSEIIDNHKSVGPLEVPYPLSWMDEERDASSWLGNTLQREAFNKLYSVAERIMLTDDKKLKQDFDYLQAAENLRFMTTKQNGIITASFSGMRPILRKPTGFLISPTS